MLSWGVYLFISSCRWSVIEEVAKAAFPSSWWTSQNTMQGKMCWYLEQQASWERYGSCLAGLWNVAELCELLLGSPVFCLSSISKIKHVFFSSAFCQLTSACVRSCKNIMLMMSGSFSFFLNPLTNVFKWFGLLLAE